MKELKEVRDERSKREAKEASAPKAALEQQHKHTLEQQHTRTQQRPRMHQKHSTLAPAAAQQPSRSTPEHTRAHQSTPEHTRAHQSTPEARREGGYGGRGALIGGETPPCVYNKI